MPSSTFLAKCSRGRGFRAVEVRLQLQGGEKLAAAGRVEEAVHGAAKAYADPLEAVALGLGKLAGGHQRAERDSASFRDQVGERVGAGLQLRGHTVGAESAPLELDGGGACERGPVLHHEEVVAPRTRTVNGREGAVEVHGETRSRQPGERQAAALPVQVSR